MHHEKQLNAFAGIMLDDCMPKHKDPVTSHYYDESFGNN